MDKFSLPTHFDIFNVVIFLGTGAALNTWYAPSSTSICLETNGNTVWEPD
ncbi:MAG: hypothetical protein ACMUEM_07525 [Flavobacteriales bacterium AspAUS03]